MKIGELYYGVSVPESEFRALEARLKRFEAAVQRTGTRQLARDMDQTGDAAARLRQRITELQGAWVGLQERYSSGRLSVQDYIRAATDLQATLGEELRTLREGSAEWQRVARLRTTVSNTLASEQLRLQKANEGASRSLGDLDRMTLRGIKSSSELQGVLASLSAEQSRLSEARMRETMSASDLLTEYNRLLASLDQQKRAISESTLSFMQKQRALGKVSTAARNTQREIDQLSLKIQGYNRHTLQAFKMSDTLSKAWLIGLGPQGYRLYLVISVLKESFQGLSAAILGAATATATLMTVFKAGGVIGALVTLGAAIAGINQMRAIEDTMADVRKTTQLSADEVQALTEAFRALSLELPKSVDELGKIATEAGRLGVTGTRNIFMFTKSIAEMDLALTGLGTQSATEIGRFLNVIGVEMRDFGDAAAEVGGILNELENNTAATAGEILHMASGMAQLRSIAEMSMRDIFAFSAALTSMNIRAEMAGSNVSKLFVEVVTDVAKGTEAVNQLAAAAGVTRDEFLAWTRETNGFSRAFQEVALNMGRAELSAEEFTLRLEALGVTNLRVRRVITALAQGHRTLTTALEVANDETRTAESLQQELAIRLATTNVQLSLLRNRFSAVVQIVGEQLLPYMRDLVENTNDAGGAFAIAGASIMVTITMLEKLLRTVHLSIRGILLLVRSLHTLHEALRLPGGRAHLDDVQRDLQRWAPDGVDLFPDLLSEPPDYRGEMIDRLMDEAIAVQNLVDTWAAMPPLEELWEHYVEVFKFAMPELIDILDELTAAAARDMPEVDLPGAERVQRTVADVVSNVHQVIAALRNMAEVAEGLDREFDLDRAIYDAINAGLSELIMNFGLAANAPEVQAFMQMLRDLGIDAEEALDRIRSAQEWLTANWVKKIVTQVEFEVMDPADALHQVDFNIDKLTAQMRTLLEPLKTGGQVDWIGVWSLQSRIDELERGRDALDNLIDAVDVTIDAEDIFVGFTDRDMLLAVQLLENSFGETVSAAEQLYDVLSRLMDHSIWGSWAANQMDKFLQQMFPRLMGDTATLAPDPETTLQQLERMNSALQGLSDAQRELRAAAAGRDEDFAVDFVAEYSLPLDDMEELYFWLLKVAEGTDVVADRARALLEEYAEVFAASVDHEPSSVMGIPDMAVGDPRTEEALNRLIERSAELRERYEALFTEPLTPAEAFRAELEAIAAGTDLLAIEAQALLNMMDTDLVNAFEEQIAAARRWSSVLAGTYAPGTFDELAHELDLLGNELRIREAQLEDFTERFGEGSPQVLELQVTIQGLRAEIERLRALQDFDVSERLDMSAAAVAARETEAAMRTMNDALDDFNASLGAAVDPLQQYRQMLLLFAESDLPRVAAHARSLLRQFDEGLFGDFAREVKEAQMASESLAKTFPEGLFDPIAHELDLANTMLAIHLRHLETVESAYEHTSEEAEELRAEIQRLREEVHRLETLADLDVSERLDMSRAAVEARQLEHEMRLLNGAFESFHDALMVSRDPLRQHRDLILELSRSGLPLARQYAENLLEAFDRQFFGRLVGEISELEVASRVLAGTFPEGMFDATAHEVELLEGKLRLKLAALQLATLVYNENSDQVRNLQVQIMKLRARLNEVTQDSDIDHFAALAERLEAIAASAERINATQIFPSATDLEIDTITAQLRELENTLATPPEDATQEFLEATQEQARALRIELAELEHQRATDAAADESRLAAQEAAVQTRLDMQDALADGIRTIMGLQEEERTETQLMIEQYEKLQEAMPDGMAAGFQQYIDMLKDREAAESAEALGDMQERVAEMSGKTTDRFLALIPEVHRLGELYGWTAEEVLKLVVALKKMSAEAGQLDDLRAVRDAMKDIIGVSETLFDMWQEDAWTDGNKLLDAYYEISAVAAGAIAESILPGSGAIVSEMVSMVGEFVNKILGDMSDGLREVQAEIEQMAGRSAFLAESVVEALTATKQVSRGGLLGLLGFTKTAIDRELTDLSMSIAEGMASALREGLIAAVSGSQDWKQDIRKAIRDTVSGAIVDALIEEMIIASALAEFVAEFVRVLRDEGAQAAADYARSQLAGVVEGLVDDVEEAAEILRDAGIDFGESVADQIGSALYSAVTSAMSRGIMDALRGGVNWRQTMRDSIREAVVQALVDAFIEAAIMTAILQPFIDEITRLLTQATEGGRSQIVGWVDAEGNPVTPEAHSSGRGLVLDGLQPIWEPLETPEGGQAAAARYVRDNLPAILDDVEETAEWILEVLEEFGLVTADQVANALQGGFTSAIRGGIMAALKGDQDWKTQLADGLKDAVVGALMDAFIQAMILTSGMQEFVDEFTRILTEEGPEAAAKYARDNMRGVIAELQEGAEIIARELYDTGLVTPPTGDYGDDDVMKDRSMFTLPTATVGIVTATPSWVEGLGMHFDKFGGYVDRLVDEGIRIEVGSEVVQASGVNARDARLAR